MEDPLALDPETMRTTGYRMVDLLVEHVAGVRDRPALTRASPAEMRERLHGPAPEGGTDLEAMLAVLERDVLPYHYPRLATVVAAEDLRLAKLTAETLRSLMGAVPAIEEAVRQAATERLAVS
jgi:CRP-like cAMP-binding protein